MGNALRAQTIDSAAPADTKLLVDFVIARIASANGATKSELARDFAPFVTHRLSPSELRTVLDAAIDDMLEHQFAASDRGRYRLTEPGETAALELLGGRSVPRDWAEIRDVRLVARALGLHKESALRLKSLARPDGLRAAILQQAFGIKGKRPLSPARLRSALAGVALERAFGNKIKGDIAAGEGLSARAGRQLAGQLSRRPRDFGTDSRLIAALAAETVGAIQSDLAALRLAVLRNEINRRLPSPAATSAPRSACAAAERQHPATAAPAMATTQPESRATNVSGRPAAANRPDLRGFADVVRAVADEFAEGWPGNRKALIVHVWRTVRDAYPEWGLTEIEFKAMLTEAHRTGHVVLANADLKNKTNARDIQDSAISFKNTVWHFVRIES
ncbi:MAG TPA: hypothetical protein VMX97_11870 [Hyphomicrobiaceae bacterium]|nr:hypothetical protein [Hyphomicrobiaceae bacterium]